MRFIGLVMVLIGIAVGYFLGFRNLTVTEARARLAQLLNLPGLASSSPSSPGTTPGAQGQSGLGSGAGAGAGVAGGGGGSW